jgi:hypothetical protein
VLVDRAPQVTQPVVDPDEHLVEVPRVAGARAPRGWVVLLARYQRPKALRQSGITRLTRTLADAGVRNAPTIAQAAVPAAKAQTVRLPGEEVAAGLVAQLARGVIASMNASSKLLIGKTLSTRCSGLSSAAKECVIAITNVQASIVSRPTMTVTE